MEPKRQMRLVVLATIGAAFMSTLDLFVVNVAFDDIGRDLGLGLPGGPSAGDLSWILNAYAVTYAALLVPFGRLADRYGRKQLFVTGLMVFVVASLACAFAANVWVLVAARVLQAVGGAAMTPTSLSLLMAALPPEKRVGGVRLWAATGALAAAIGPTVGGMLTELSWHWVFLINLPVGLALVALAVTQVVEPPAAGETGTPDLVGALVFAGSVALLALALVKSPEWGWGSGRTTGTLIASAALAGWFTLRSRRHPSPVIRPELLGVRSFRYANLAMLGFNIAFAANLLVGILWLQQVWGWSALATGYAVAAGPAVVPITAALTHRFLPRADPAHLVAAGSLVTALGVALLAARMGTESAYVTTYLPGWLISGVGAGLAMPNLMAGATRGLAAHESATGSAVITMTRQIGFVIGVSLLFAIVGDLRGAAAVDGLLATWWASVAVLAGTGVLALGMRPRTTTNLAVETAGQAAA